MTISVARQRNAVSQGLALGFLLNGATGLEGNKTSIDMAVVGAWRKWPHKHLFPNVHTQLTKHYDGMRVLTHADATRHVFCLYWESVGAGYDIYARQNDWFIDDPDDIRYALNMIDGDLSADAWECLAGSVLDGLGSGARARTP
ncbi:hypothetical protein [Kytococcus sedentarius]|uniref:hypothetical protein n=1 Tax=Kytococcus sedentarius TaxID=1276 RepID=UPI0035BC2B08